MLFKKILEKKHSFQRLVSLLTTCFPPGLEGDLRPDLALYFFSIDLYTGGRCRVEIGCLNKGMVQWV